MHNIVYSLYGRRPGAIQDFDSNMQFNRDVPNKNTDQNAGLSYLAVWVKTRLNNYTQSA